MKPTAIKAVKRNESLKKTKISQLALDLQADSPVSPKKSRASTNFSNFEKNATINGSLTQRMTTPERKKNLRKSISNSDLQALSEATKQKSLKLHLERRKSRFTYEDIHNAISNVRPPTPSFLADTSMFAVTPRGSNMTAKLHGACAAGRVEQFQELIDKTIEMENFLDLNASHLDMDSNKCTLMHTAAKHGRVPIMHILWNKGASIDVPDSLDATPLFYAAASGSLRACAFLLSKNAQVNIRDRFDNTPLSIALRSNHYDIAKLMFFFKSDVHFKVTSKGQTLLHLACEEGSDTKVDFLLENGATVFRTNREDETPLFKALGHVNIVKLILHSVASEPLNLIKLIRMINARGETVIHHAVVNNHMTSLLAILESIPTPTYTRQLKEILNDNEKTVHQNTPLHMAVLKNNLPIMKLLVMCEEIDMTKQNVNGDTALHLAVKERNQEMIYILKQFDFEKKSKLTRNNKKLTPKQLAKELKCLDIYYYDPNEESPSPRRPSPRASPRDSLKSPRDTLKSFINSIKKISPRAQLTSRPEEERNYNAEQQQREFVKQLRLTLKADMIQPIVISSADSHHVALTAPPPPPLVTIQQVQERLDDLGQLLSCEGDFNDSSAGKVVLLDASASFVRVVRLYVSSLEKKITNDATLDQVAFFDGYRKLQVEIQQVCLSETEQLVDMEKITKWKQYITEHCEFPLY